jgi:hypothetical protein
MRGEKWGGRRRKNEKFKKNAVELNGGFGSTH